MKHILSRSLSLLFLMVVLGSCSKADHNGLLGGNWQLNDHVYFSVYTDMVQWRNTQQSTIYMGCFRHSGDSLVLTLSDRETRGIYANDGSSDEPVTVAELLPVEFGIPANFGYRIIKNTGSELQLQAGATTLVLRRY